MQGRDEPDRLTLAAFTVAVVIGGSNFVAVKFSNAELDPMYDAAGRFSAAAVVFLLLGWALSLRLPEAGRYWAAWSMVRSTSGLDTAYSISLCSSHHRHDRGDHGHRAASR